MNRTCAALIAASACLLAMPSEADAGRLDIKDALGDVRDAIDHTRDARAGCRDRILASLKDTRDDIKDLLDASAPRPRAIRRTRDALKSAQGVASKRCDEQTARRLRSASRALADALEDARDERVEERRDDTRPDERYGENRERVRERREAVVVTCWNKKDPGCLFARGGKQPMDKPAWESFIKGLRGAQPSVFEMEDYVKINMRQRHLTAMQLGVLVDEFRPHVFQMLDVVKICAPRLVDPQHAQHVTTRFQPHKFQANDAAKILANQAPGKKLKGATVR